MLTFRSSNLLVGAEKYVDRALDATDIYRSVLLMDKIHLQYLEPYSTVKVQIDLNNLNILSKTHTPAWK